MERHVFDLLAHHGTPLLFLMQMFGVFGLPIPDELLLTIAGALIRRGDLNPSATIGAAIAGSLTGITFSYSLGRMVGPRVLRRLPFLDAQSLDRGQAWFRRSGKWLLAFGCFVPGVRHITPIAAGSASLDFRAFATYAYPGAALWSSTFVAAGYYAGDHWERAAVLLRAHVIVVSIVFAAVAIGYVFVRRHELR
jgi:membrane protein DedA with SNARE-associated domain